VRQLRRAQDHRNNRKKTRNKMPSGRPHRSSFSPAEYSRLDVATRRSKTSRPVVGL
jgi:hypothetical protein